VEPSRVSGTSRKKAPAIDENFARATWEKAKRE